MPLLGGLYMPLIGFDAAKIGKNWECQVENGKNAEKIALQCQVLGEKL